MSADEGDVPWAGVFGALSVGAWLAWTFFLIHLGRNSPAEPDASAGNVIRFENHGVFYVTEAELYVSRGLLIAAVAFIAASLVAELARRFTQPR